MATDLLPASQKLHLIVVGVDGSSESMAALRWALDLGSPQNAEVRVVYAWEPAPVYVKVTMVAARDEAQRWLSDLIQDLPGESKVTGVVVEGPPMAALLLHAREADLLVVGSRGRGGFASLLLGSVSTQSVHHAPCPVLVIRQPAKSD